MDQLFRTQHIVFFDGECGFCNAAVRWILQRDTHHIFKFASLQSDAGKEIKQHLSLDPGYIQSIIVWEPHQQKGFVKSRAAAEILKQLPGYRWLYLSLKTIPLFIADFLYGLVARYRKYLPGGADSCDLRYRTTHAHRFL